MKRREEILSSARSVPSIPATALEAVRLLQDPEGDIAELIRAVEYDPDLTSNVLRLASSAYFGGSETTSSLTEAVGRLGVKRILQIIIVSAVTPLIEPPVKGYDLSAGELWKHSVAVAIGAEQLAAALDLRPPEYMFTAALLHDIGKIVLDMFVAADVDPILALADGEEVSFEVAEQRVLGADHTEAGAALLKNWSLPDTIVEVNRWHHCPERFSGDTLIVDLIHVADALCMMGAMGLGADGLRYRLSREVVSRLNLTTLAVETAVCGILSEMKELDGLFTNDMAGDYS